MTIGGALRVVASVFLIMASGYQPPDPSDQWVVTRLAGRMSRARFGRLDEGRVTG
jgi:hypothetical protein